ncbi:transposase [Methyloprofundus sedimenti]|uniref:transposase n=1 Tax=Methyloprofundus sedimenti TaxID=1420851 RepID=UPI0018E9A52F|nr:transposase [Methyloprofundus sedimenti]
MQSKRLASVCIQRGNNRVVVFVADEDYHYYLSILKAACQKYPFDLDAYVMMTNHIHLLFTLHAENSISKVMQSLGRY